MEVQRLPRQLLGGVVEDAREGHLGGARRLAAVGTLHLVWDHQAGGARNHQLQDVLGLLPVWTLEAGMDTQT